MENSKSEPYTHIALGGLAGVIALSVATVLHDWVFSPAALSDGQYDFVFMLYTVPFGSVFGAATGYTVFLVRERRFLTASRICYAGALTALVLAGVWAAVFSGTEAHTLKNIVGNILESYLGTVIWSIGFLVWALVLSFRAIKKPS